MLSFITAIVIFFPLNYGIQSIHHWHEDIKADIQTSNEEILKNEVQKVTAQNIKEEAGTSKESPKNTNVIIPEEKKAIKSNAVWQIEIPRFRLDCTNQRRNISGCNGQICRPFR